MRLALIVSLLLVLAMGTARAAPTGDELLAQATSAPGIASYTVAVHFDVHLHRPIGTHSRVDGTIDYQAPAQAVLVIRKASGIVGMFFRGSYDLDLVPQSWPSHYHVVAVANAGEPGASTTTLTAMPRAGGEDLARVVFVLSDREPLAAHWVYRNGSSIDLTFTNARVASAMLPHTATVAVNMPKYRLDATATYGRYAVNAPIDEAVFAPK